MRCDRCPVPPDKRCIRECGERYAWSCARAAEGEPHWLASIVRRSEVGCPEPGLIQKAVNFAGAVAEHVAGGMKLADPETVQKRLAICRECEWFDAERATCKQCGCLMSVKAEWAEQSCPIGKW